MKLIKEYNNFKLDRVMKSLFKNCPKYVFDEFYNADGGMFRKLVSELLDDGYDIDDIEDHYSDYIDLDWELKTLELNIDDFSIKTQKNFRKREMGDKHMSFVPDDENRTKWQRENVIEGDNEPLVMFQHGQEYELLEGYHRCMALLKKGDNNSGDYSNWRKVRMKSYVALK